MPRKPVSRALANIDREALAEFQAGIRKRYSNDQIVEQLKGCAERLGRSPTMREFEADPETSVHPQTVIQHFGSWNEAKRNAGLVPRRFAKPADLVRLLRELGDEIGRPPTAKDLDDHRASMPSKSLYWHTFGSLKNALREAGFDVPVGEERLERAIGVIYRPETERISHYFGARIGEQFDAVIHIDETTAVRPLEVMGQVAPVEEEETFPTGI